MLFQKCPPGTCFEIFFKFLRLLFICKIDYRLQLPGPVFSGTWIMPSIMIYQPLIKIYGIAGIIPIFIFNRLNYINRICFQASLPANSLRRSFWRLITKRTTSSRFIAGLRRSTHLHSEGSERRRVEPVGVEPTSENKTRRTSTCLASFYFSTKAKTGKIHSVRVH